MGKHCHRRADSGIFAVGGGNDDGVQPQRHCQNGNDADLQRSSKRQEKQDQDPNHGKQQKADHRDRPDPQSAEGILKADPGYRDAGEQHCDGRHTVARHRNGRSDKPGELPAGESKYDADDHSHEHRIEERTKAVAYRLFTAGDQKRGHTPKVDQHPEWDGEDQILQKDGRKHSTDHCVAHKAEVGKGKSVGVELAGVIVAGTQAGEDQRKEDRACQRRAGCQEGL